MCLLCRYISENTDNIVVMSGEGADELAQGYIYFHKQPTAEDGDIESRQVYLLLRIIVVVARLIAKAVLGVRQKFF